jgi:hypothetical protein
MRQGLELAQQALVQELALALAPVSEPELALESVLVWVLESALASEQELVLESELALALVLAPVLALALVHQTLM